MESLWSKGSLLETRGDSREWGGTPNFLYRGDFLGRVPLFKGGESPQGEVGELFFREPLEELDIYTREFLQRCRGEANWDTRFVDSIYKGVSWGDTTSQG